MRWKQWIWTITAAIAAVMVSGEGELSCWDPSSFTDIQPEDLVGDYVQVFSSKYLVTSSLIGLSCVTVSVTGTSKKGVLNVTQSAIQHGHKNMRVVKTRMFSGWGQNTSAVPWTDGIPGPSQVFETPGYLVRCAWPVKSPQLIIWTGLDNLSMEVWTTDIERYVQAWDTLVKNYLTTIEYRGGYKTPVLTYDSNSDLCS